MSPLCAKINAAIMLPGLTPQSYSIKTIKCFCWKRTNSVIEVDANENVCLQFRFTDCACSLVLEAISNEESVGYASMKGFDLEILSQEVRWNQVVNRAKSSQK